MGNGWMREEVMYVDICNVTTCIQTIEGMYVDISNGKWVDERRGYVCGQLTAGER